MCLTSLIKQHSNIVINEAIIRESNPILREEGLSSYRFRLFWYAGSLNFSM